MCHGTGKIYHPERIVVLDVSKEIVPEPSLLVDKLQVFLGKYKDAIKLGSGDTMTATWAISLEKLLEKANFRRIKEEK